ncbi:MAG: GHMP kinase [Chthonomonadaceae bacterium]|nr:GHMP kinase [Chthonomonadaceae bacterium]
MTDLRSRFTPLPFAEERWEIFAESVRTDYDAFFDAPGPIVGARAPGRLDIMGGVADYSGSIVLEMPLSEAAYCAWQWREDRLIRVQSLNAQEDGFDAIVEIPLSDLVDEDNYILTPEEVRRRLNSDPAKKWAAYVVGCYYVMLQAYGKISQGKADNRLGDLGANILISSEVPIGAGVSSSAALEVATMCALSEAAGIHPSELTLAAWCQKVENMIVGAPCGIMDQVTSALGRENALLVLQCQPHTLLGHQIVPKGWKFIGLDSRVKHSVGGTAYTKARVGAFMGLKVIQLESGGKLLHNYLCRMSVQEFQTYKEMIPTSITGLEYNELFGRLPDIVTRVNPSETYRPRDCAEHPILENERVKEFVGLMSLADFRREERQMFRTTDPDGNNDEGDPDTQLMKELGQLMYEAHASYSQRLDLGSPETDLLVHLIQERGVERGLYGAKITGGGSGGTVAVFLADTEDAHLALSEVCDEYEKQIGVAPYAFVGSGPGALEFGAKYITRG